MLGVPYISPSVDSLKGPAPRLTAYGAAQVYGTSRTHGGLAILQYPRAADRKEVVTAGMALAASRVPTEPSSLGARALGGLAPRSTRIAAEAGMLPAYPRSLPYGQRPSPIGEAILQAATVPMPEYGDSRSSEVRMTERLYQRASDVARSVVPSDDIAAGQGVDHRGGAIVNNRWRAPDPTHSEIAMRTVKVNLAIRSRRAH